MIRLHTVTIVAAALIATACTTAGAGDASMAPDTGDTAGGEAADDGAGDTGGDDPAAGRTHEGTPGEGLPPSYDMENRTPVPLQVVYEGVMVREVPPMSTMSLGGLGPRPLAPFTLRVRRADMPDVVVELEFHDAGQGGRMPLLPQHWAVDLADEGAGLVASHPGLQ